MYSTDDERPPKKPVIGSQAGALLEVQRWMQENRYDTIADADGLVWRLSIESEERPASHAPRELEIELRFILRASVTPAELIRIKAFDPVADARFLSLIEGETIPLAMRPIVRVAAGLEEARRLVQEELPRLRAKLMGPGGRELKRGLAAKWLEKISVFGSLDPIP